MEIVSKIFVAALPYYWMAFLPFLVIIGYLLISGHASIGRNGDSKTSCCGDKRVKRGVTVFGGSSAFTFGIHWGLLAYLIGLDTRPGMLFASYGLLQFILSCIQTVTYLSQLARYRKANIRVEPLKAHLEGCGFTTAWSPLWPLFWLSKVPALKGLVVVRDAMTILDWLVSLPFVGFVLNPFALIVGKKIIKPEISHVDIRE